MTTKLPLEQVVSYSDAVESFADESYSKALAFIESLVSDGLDIENTQALADVLEWAAAAIIALIDKYGDGAAYLAANLYDDIVAKSDNGAQSALMIGGESSEAVKKIVNGWQGYLESDDSQTFSSIAADYVRASVRNCANETMLRNISRDGQRGVGYALIPTSAHPCEWCVMLISRGFVYATKGIAGISQHANCRCKIVPGCDGLEIEGFDFGSYEDLWAASTKAVSSNAAYSDYNAMGAAERKNAGYKSFNDFLMKRQLAVMRQLRKNGEFAAI